MKIYLAGPINGCTDEDAHGWRDHATAELDGHEILNPMARDYRGFEMYNPSEIVAGDLRDIDRCDVLLAFCWQPSYGTAMEIFYAASIGKRVVVVSHSRSPWLTVHAVCIDTLEDALQYVADLEART